MINQKTINADRAIALSSDEAIRIEQLEGFVRDISERVAEAKNQAQEAFDLAGRLELVLMTRRNAMTQERIDEAR